jgi:asparagine synthase (glutamine-hydrolysing)
MELCLALPPSQKLSRGWTRAVQRRAAEGVVPAEIQWRLGKADLSPNFVRGLLEREQNTLNRVILEAPGVLAAYYDLKELQTTYERVRSQPAPKEADILTVYGATVLGLWLGGRA